MIGEIILSIIGSVLVIVYLGSVVAIFAYAAWALWKDEFNRK